MKTLAMSAALMATVLGTVVKIEDKDDGNDVDDLFKGDGDDDLFGDDNDSGWFDDDADKTETETKPETKP